MRLKLIVSYDGAPFAGWQSQASRTAVQDVLEAAFQAVSGTRVVVHGAGRTDAGVHALGQCAHADVPNGPLAPPDWQRALNANLPAAVRVMEARRTLPGFHARFSATGKIYRYLIRNGPVLPPLETGRVWHVPQKLDPALLRAAAAAFTGSHDFAAFSANRGSPARETRRTIDSISVAVRGGLFTVTFRGGGFLYKMVRMLTGAMVRSAQGREPISALKARLEHGAPRWNHVAPADGLYLVRVLY